MLTSHKLALPTELYPRPGVKCQKFNLAEVKLKCVHVEIVVPKMTKYVMELFSSYSLRNIEIEVCRDKIQMTTFLGL